jgi:type I restriction enzyme M protein
MKHDTKLGSRIAEVHNGSSLFTGDAGQGESNIRRWIIENDWLEAIVALPLNMFYNTGIATYIWVISNRKPEHRRGKVQLIDATEWFKPLRNNLGKKNCELSDEDIARICDTFVAFKETEHSKISPNTAFGYWKVMVERPLRIRSADPNRAYSPKEIKDLKTTSEVDESAPPVIRKIHKAGKIKPDPCTDLLRPVSVASFASLSTSQTRSCVTPNRCHSLRTETSKPSFGEAPYRRRLDRRVRN